MSYREFLKSWQQDNNISSFFGSDKQEFLADWKEAKKPKTRFGEKIVTEPMEIAEPTVSEKVSPNITIAPPKPKRTAAETVLTNPDLLKEIGSFNKPKLTNEKFVIPASFEKFRLFIDNSPEKVVKYITLVSEYVYEFFYKIGSGNNAFLKIYKSLIRFLRDFSKKNKNATNNDVWNYILSMGDISKYIEDAKRGYEYYGPQYSYYARDMYNRKKENKKGQNLLFNFLLDDLIKSEK